MLLFFIKQMFSLKRAILGRREPHQLAWGLALGVLLGIVPHGTLIALAIFLFILSVRVNHGMVAVTAVATTVVAAKLDAQTHLVGKYVLTHPDLAHHLSLFWQWPLVPWTDINNTVVMGGLLIGLAALLPSYLLSYPIFHYLAPPTNDLPAETAEPAPHGDAVPSHAGPAAEKDSTDADRPIDVPHEPSATSENEDTPSIGGAVGVDSALAEVESTAMDAAFGDVARAQRAARQVTVDTRIEVIRVSKPTAGDRETTPVPTALAEPEQAAEGPSQQDQPMSEALNYLLRQLRDSRQRRAA